MGTDSQGVDYLIVLADLEARKAQIESAIVVIKGLVSAGITSVPVTQTISMAQPSAQPSGQPSAQPTIGATEIQSDTFFGLNIMEATKKFLAMRKRPVMAPEIVESLRKGGQIHSMSETFANTLGSILSRSEANGGPIVRIGRGTYGLREWYANKSRSEASE